MREPVHSGETLRDDLDALAMSPAADARRRHGTACGGLREPRSQAGHTYGGRRRGGPGQPHINPPSSQ